MSQIADIATKTISCEASEYIQNANLFPKKLEFNLDAAEYKPKELVEYINEIEAFEDQIQDQIDEMIEKEEEKEIMEELLKHINMGDDSDSEDEDKWLPKYKDCKCCKGFVYNCKGESCASLGQCYCKMIDEVDSYEENKELREKGNKEEDNNNKKCETLLN